METWRFPGKQSGKNYLNEEKDGRKTHPLSLQIVRRDCPIRTGSPSGFYIIRHPAPRPLTDRVPIPAPAKPVLPPARSIFPSRKNKYTGH